MRNILIVLVLNFAWQVNANAAAWVKLQDNGNAKLMLDKQSILDKDKYKRAWVKVSYKTPQVNIEVADKAYNESKMLWFFDCPTQTAATAQVFQYFNDEVIYSAAVDYKAAKFIEPVPETDIDYAMRYVCEVGKPAKAPVADTGKKVDTTLPEKKVEEVKPEPAKTEQAESAPATEKPAAAPEKEPVADKPKETAKQESKGSHKAHWTYQGKEGPTNWGKLNQEFATCDTGRNQSPINIEKAIPAALKELKTLQKFPAKDIVNNGHTVQVSFKDGNMMVLDNLPFQMKHAYFHTPSEHTLKGKSYPLEIQLVHIDSKGEQAIIAILFEESESNPALARLVEQLPKEYGKPLALKSRLLPSELMPQKRAYYRFGGSLTTPPCTEGVRWVLMKTPATASKSQIDAFRQAVPHANNRPVQSLQGRLVLE